MNDTIATIGMMVSILMICVGLLFLLLRLVDPPAKPDDRQDASETTGKSPAPRATPSRAWAPTMPSDPAQQTRDETHGRGQRRRGNERDIVFHVTAAGVFEQTTPARPLNVVNRLEFDVDLIYRDSRGRETERLVSVNQVTLLPDTEPPRALSFLGFCHKRNGVRSFDVYRVVQIADANTGEVATDPGAWLADMANGAGRQ